MEDGRAVLSEETKRLMRTDYQEYIRQVGADDTYWMLQDNRMQSEWMPQEDGILRQMEEWTYPYGCYTGQYDVLFASGSEMETAQKKIEAVHGQMLPWLLLAPTEEEFERLWDEYVTLREENGLSAVLQESTRQMRAAKEKLGME